MRLALNLLKYDRLRRVIASLDANGAPDVEVLRRIAWGVSKASRYVPRATCLTQALAGQYMLARRGIASRIRFGVDATGAEFRAHAWLISGDRIVLGGSAQSMRGFNHLADFG
jgi:hypothetical protein